MTKRILFILILIFACGFTSFAQEKNCPQISLLLPSGILYPKQPADFTVTISPAEKKDFKYFWIVSIGKIIQGQETSKIKFLAGRENQGMKVDVSVKVVGLPVSCANVASQTISVAPLPIGEPVANYGKVNRNSDKAYLDNLFIQIENDPGSKALIVLQFDRKDNLTYRVNRLKAIYQFIKFRKYDLNRTSFIIFEDDNEQTTLWVASQDADLPEINSKNYQMIEGEKLQQKTKGLFRRN